MGGVAFLFKININTIILLISLICAISFSLMATFGDMQKTLFKIKKFNVQLRYIISIAFFVVMLLFTAIMYGAGNEKYFESFIEPIEIKWYAIFIVTGMVVAIVLAYLLLVKKGYEKDYLFTLALWTLPIAILGTRIYYGMFDGATWTFKEFWNFRSGGLAIYGGVIFAIFGIIICALTTKKPVLKTLDIVAAVVLFGQMLGRWGNFANQEAFGQLVTNESLQWFPYAVYIDKLGGWYQATFFYESILNLIGFIILYVYAYKYNKCDGNIAFGYFVWYGMTRVFIEKFRSDSLMLGSIRVSQLVSLIFIVIGVVGIFLVNFYKKGKFYHHFIPLENGKVVQTEVKTQQAVASVQTQSENSEIKESQLGEIKFSDTEKIDEKK